MSEEQASEKQGMSTGAKVAIGFGIAAVLLFGTCVAGVFYVGSHAQELVAKGNSLAKTAMAEQWSELRTTTEQLMTDEGAQAWYAAHPGIQAHYPSAAAFLEAVRAWRPRLEPVPEAPPDLQTGRVSFSSRIDNGTDKKQIGYRNARGAYTELRWENHQIVDFSVR